MFAKGKTEPVCIVGLGACTAIGANAPSAAAAVRAGITGFHEHPFMIDKAGEKMIVARVPVLSADADIADRVSTLALSAAREALTPLLHGSSDTSLAMPVILGLPSQRPGKVHNNGEILAGNMQELDGRFRLTGLSTFASGHSAGLMALGAGCEEIEAGHSEFCLVGGVDSYLEAETLEWLDETEQLHSEANTWGFTPGEGAGFCLVCSQSAAERRRLEPLGWVLEVSTAMEQNLIRTDTVCVGQGLSQAVKQVLPVLPSPDGKISQTICDMNGERYRADELAFTICRTSERFVDATDFLSPADCWGDVGAASGPLFVGLAAAASRRGYSKGSYTLLWTSSDTGERSAAVVYCESSSET
jgi:3-oxoacyl-[acyl-carrier-protein] synthase I